MKFDLVKKVITFCIAFIFSFNSFSQEICDNGIDDNGDGLIDLNDPTCTLNCGGFGGSTSTSVPSFIPNSSFEDNSCCPTSWSQLNCADTWVQATSATSDYFNSCGWMPSIVPQPLPDGNGIVAAIFSSGYQEYIGACLLQPMVAGTQYDIQFNIAAESVTGTLTPCGNINTFDPIDVTIFGNASCGNLPVSTTGCPTTNGWVALGTANYTPDNTWGTLTITINPTVDINAIMIGSPCTLPNGYNGSCYGYFMFDNMLLNTSSSFNNAGVTVAGSGTWQSNSTTITASPDSIAGIYQWYLDGIALPNGADTSLFIPSVCSNTFGTGVLTFVQTIDTACVSVDYSITLPEFPTAGFIANDGCMGTEVVFTDTSSSGGNTLIDWQWNFGDGATDTTQATTHTFASDGTYNVQLVVADSICTDTVIIPVTIYPIPDAQFTNLNGCLGFDIDFQDNSTVNPPDNITTWEWDFGNGTTSGVQDPTALYGNTGAFPVELIVTTNNGCKDTIQQPVDLYDNPVADFIVLNDECLYSSVSFMDQSTIASGSIVNYEWDFGDNNTSLIPNPSNLYGAQATYDVELVVTSGNGCTDTVVYQYTPLEVPVASFSSTSECIYDSLVFTDNSTLIAPGSFLWSFGDATAIVSDQNPSHLYSTVGEFNVTLIVTSDNGCVDDVVIPYSAYPVPNLGFSSNIICENEPPTTFNNTSNIASGNIAVWNWDFGDGGSSNIEDPTHAYVVNGVFPVTLIAVSDNNCRDTLVQNASVLTMPTALFSGDVLEGCSPHCVDFVDVSVSNAGSITSWRWDFGTGPSSTNQNPNECFPNSSNTTDAVYDVELIATNDLGCSDTLLMTDYIISWPMPFPSFTPTPDAMDMHHTEEIIFTNNTIGGISYEWDFDNGESSTAFEPTTFYGDTGVYVVTMTTTTPNGCVDSTYEVVRIYAVVTLFAPNTFTPNGDGINDDFMFKCYGIVEEGLEFMIFDRWGEMIYKAESFKAWDGYSGGVLSPEGTYVYKIECKDVFGEKRTYRGHVNLLK